MSGETTSLSFRDFFEADTRKRETRVVGTYLWPLCLFGPVDYGDPLTATEIIEGMAANDVEILITRMGGMFVRPPQDLSDPYSDASRPAGIDLSPNLQEKLAFEDSLATAMNEVVCELGLRGVVSDPVSPVYLSYGQAIDGHALALVGSGGQETYYERSVWPATALVRGDWISWPNHEEHVVHESASLLHSTRLSSISKTLPLLVAGSYSAFSRRQQAEAILDSWIVIEQLVDESWASCLEGIPENERSALLRDRREPLAAFRTDLLLLSGHLGAEIHEAFHKARRHRNRLAHRATLSSTAAEEVRQAFTATLSSHLGEAVVAPSFHASVNW